MDPLYPAAVTALTLLFYLFTLMLAGRQRAKHRVPAPAVTGHPEFERAYRVQMNTLENMIVFLPAMWLFAWSVSAGWAAAIGLVWIAGRALYAVCYLRDPGTRAPGMIVTFGAEAVLLLGALYGIGLKVL